MLSDAFIKFLKFSILSCMHILFIFFNFSICYFHCGSLASSTKFTHNRHVMPIDMKFGGGSGNVLMKIDDQSYVTGQASECILFM
jgi:hypothetical protein